MDAYKQYGETAKSFQLAEHQSSERAWATEVRRRAGWDPDMGTGGDCSDLTSLFISGPEVGCYTMKTYQQDSS